MAERPAYIASGVDVDAGQRAVELMRSAIDGTRRPEVLGEIGGFGSAVTIPPGYRSPVLISSTDGVGTKTAIATALRRYDTIGRDLVAMCADDVACSGAEPLFFLDYVAVGRLDPDHVEALVRGVAEGCRQAGCALIGGEMAEHPGAMEDAQFDLAGFAVGHTTDNGLRRGGRAPRASPNRRPSSFGRRVGRGSPRGSPRPRRSASRALLAVRRGGRTRKAPPGKRIGRRSRYS